MTDEIFRACVQRIREYSALSGQQAVHIVFHGGEPCLAGPAAFSKWCAYATEQLAGELRVRFTIQTNGTLLDDRWMDAFKRHDVTVGISTDGPQQIHDLFRVDHAGRGSYDDVIRGITLARQAEVKLYLLCVIQFGNDGLKVHRHLMSLGVPRISYLIPDYSHDSIAQIRQCYGDTPCADFLIPIFDDWWSNGTIDTRIGLFWSISRLILGGEDDTDIFGNQPLRTVFVETDGSIEGLDVLRVCENGLTATGLNVQTHTFEQLKAASPMHAASIFSGMELPTDCNGCREQDTCGGGYLPHRYSRARMFDNPSVWCADILRLFGHIRNRLGVPPEGTARRREIVKMLERNVSAGRPQ